MVKWLQFPALQEEVSSLDRKYAFGSDLDLDLLGLEIDDKTLVPGLAVASSRAKPLAGMLLPPQIRGVVQLVHNYAIFLVFIFQNILRFSGMIALYDHTLLLSH